MTEAERMLKTQKKSAKYNYSDANSFNHEVISEFKLYQKIKARKLMQKLRKKLDL